MSRDRRQRAVGKVQPGDGHALKPYTFFSSLTSTQFSLQRPEQDGLQHTYTVWLDYFSEEEDVHLYRDGAHHAQSSLPATFPVPGGLVTVATSTLGLKRMHFVPDQPEGFHLRPPEKLLSPHPQSLEGRRAQFALSMPRASAWVGRLAVLVLVVSAILGLPQLLELVTSWDIIADTVGSFTSPIRLSETANTALTIAALVAGLERALTVRYHWLLDGSSDLDFDDMGS